MSPERDISASQPILRHLAKKTRTAGRSLTLVLVKASARLTRRNWKQRVYESPSAKSPFF